MRVQKMDAQKTIEFILDQQAKSAEQQYKTDRRVEAIAKLVQTGMKMLVQFNKVQARHDAWLVRLEEKHARTEKRIDRMLDELRRQRSNGHGRN